MISENLRKGLVSMLLLAAFCLVSNSVDVKAQNDTESRDSTNTTTYSVDGKTAETVLSVKVNESNYKKSINRFDRISTYLLIYNHIRTNNKELETKEVYILANQIVDELALESERSLSNDKSSTSIDGPIIVDLGQIVDGDLVENSAGYKFELPENSEINIKSFVPDSRTSIISEGWSVKPYEASKITTCKYTTLWTGLDLFKTNISGKHTVESTYEVSKTMGFEAGGELTSKEVAKYGLTVSGSRTTTSKITQGSSFNVPAWTKMCKRPYIYYYARTYKGIKQYYCYNYFDKRYFYVYEDYTAHDNSELESSIRIWSRTNNTKNKNAVSPMPPEGWEW